MQGFGNLLIDTMDAWGRLEFKLLRKGDFHAPRGLPGKLVRRPIVRGDNHFSIKLYLPLLYFSYFSLILFNLSRVTAFLYTRKNLRVQWAKGVTILGAFI